MAASVGNSRNAAGSERIGAAPAWETAAHSRQRAPWGTVARSETPATPRWPTACTVPCTCAIQKNATSSRCSSFLDDRLTGGCYSGCRGARGTVGRTLPRGVTISQLASVSRRSRPLRLETPAYVMCPAGGFIAGSCGQSKEASSCPLIEHPPGAPSRDPQEPSP